MNEEQRFSPEGLVRVNVELDARDVHATWVDADEILVRGVDVDALVQADELFITSESGRRNNPGPVEIELPERRVQSAFKIHRGDVRLANPQGKVEINVDSGDVTVRHGSGSLTVASGRGDTAVEDYHGELVLSSGSGDKSLRDVFGDVTIRSSKGDTRLSGGEGRTIVASASGDIEVKDRDCTELTISGASGDISVSGGSLGTGTISAASGDIHCDSRLAVATYDFTVSSGDISISVPRGLPARVDAATSRGNVSTDLPLVAIAQRGPRNPHGKRLVGSTSEAPERASITLRTSRGDIAVRWGTVTAPATDGSERQLSARDIEARRTAELEPVSTTEPETSAVAANMPEGESATVPAGSVATGDDRKRAILSALRDGAISIEEAGMLLDAIDRAQVGKKGG